MLLLNFKKIDAFTKGTSSGNPAGYVHLEQNQNLRDDQMLAIAKELKHYVNEVGFVTEKLDGYHLKFYSSQCEVDFCGHATIAIMYDLLMENHALNPCETIDIHVNAGKLVAFNHIDDLDAVYIMAPAPTYLNHTLTREEIANHLNIDKYMINNQYNIELINGGLRTLIVPILALDHCLAIHPDEASLKLFCLNNAIDIVLVFSEETHLTDSDYRTRVFAPKFGYLEDPATGSGNSAFGYYLDSLGMLKDNLTIEQSANRDNPNFVKLKPYNYQSSKRILFGGCATNRIVGTYHLHTL